MTLRDGRYWTLALLTLAAVAAVFRLDPIEQDPAYHAFADRRAWLGLPNFANFTSNLPFLAVGLAGLARRQLMPRPLLPAYGVYCIGVALVALGSGWYHWAPDTSRLAWDRLPMTLAFMALFALVIEDRVGAGLGRRLLWPLVLAGAASVAWWAWTEAVGRGDLRAYALVQFLPMLLIPLMLLLWPRGRTDSRWLWATLGLYGLAKLAEFYDQSLLDAGGLVSGHSLKHLLAAIAAWCGAMALAPAARASRAA